MTKKDTKNDIYIPNKGDIVWVNFDPQAGKEQAKRRPAIVLTPKLYNAKTSLFIVCPITSKVKKYPFEVYANLNNKKAAILVDQIKSLDWNNREVKFITKSSNSLLQQVLNKLSLLINE